MTKKFTKGCAVDLRGQSKLVKNTIFRTVGYDFSYMKDGSYAYDYLINNSNEEVFIGNVRGNNTILTPTDILGEHLVTAIEDGYKPWFDGDKCPQNVDLRYDDEGNVIAYKVREQPSIQAKVLSEKVSSTSFLLLSEQSHNDLLNIKASAESIKKSDCEIARALMKEVFKDLSDELDNKVGK